MDQAYGDRGVTIAVGQPALAAEGDPDGGRRTGILVRAGRPLIISTGLVILL
jgi:hypothetical protein